MDLLRTAGLVVGLGLAGIAYNTFIDNPHIVEVTRLEADKRVELAAAAAEAAERARQQKVMDDALAMYRTAVENEKAIQVQNQVEQEKRNAEYAKDRDPACDITDDDFVWMRNN